MTHLLLLLLRVGVGVSFAVVAPRRGSVLRLGALLFVLVLVVGSILAILLLILLGLDSLLLLAGGAVAGGLVVVVVAGGAGGTAVSLLGLGYLDAPGVGAAATKLQLDQPVEPLRELFFERLGHLRKRNLAVVVLGGDVVRVGVGVGSDVGARLRIVLVVAGLGASKLHRHREGPRHRAGAGVRNPARVLSHRELTDQLREANPSEPPGEARRLLTRARVRQEGQGHHGSRQFFSGGHEQFSQTRDTERDVGLAATGEVEGVEGHLRRRFPNRLARDATDRLARRRELVQVAEVHQPLELVPGHASLRD